MYKQLAKHYQPIIAEEAQTQLKYSQGNNSDALKLQTWRISIAKISGLLAYNHYTLVRTEEETDKILENTLFMFRDKVK